MLVVRAVKIPVHYGVTTHKLSILDSLQCGLQWKHQHRILFLGIAPDPTGHR